MEAFFIHLLKSSCILLLFLSVYHVFLKKETFFTGNRLFLAIGLLVSLALPFVTISKTIYVERAPVLETVSNFVTATAPNNLEETAPFDWIALLLTFYLIGVAYFTVRLILQLRSIHNIKKKSEIFREERFFHVKTNDHISPFSFFKHIFYYPHQFSNEELQTILIHEKEHAKGLHSIDILLTEIVCIVQWFNPAIWLYKIIVKQNLEFLADAKTCERHQDKKQYQYLMLKQVVGHQKIKIANPFFNSLIKKRIVMLNQNQSKRINALKLLVVLPFLVLFLVSFNTKSVVKFTEPEEPSPIPAASVIEMISPLHQNDIKKISSGFGPAKNPFTNEMDFHNGIDLVAPMGIDVMASANGTIRESATDDTHGNYIVIEHDEGYSTKYSHLKNRITVAGDHVNTGDIIGHVGNTGKSTGPHLHFEVLKSGKAINPASLIPFKAQNEKTAPKKQSIKKEKTSKPFKTVELLINKNTTDEELEKMKQNLAEKDIDFSYTVVHNNDNEIIDISINISGKSSSGEKFSGNYNSSSNNPINDILIIYDDEASMVSFSNANSKNIHVIKGYDGGVNVWSGIDEIGEHKDIVIKKGKGSKSVWVNRNTDDIETIEIKSEDGVKKVFIDGKEVDASEIHANHFSFHTDDDHDVKIKVVESKGKKKKKHRKHKNGKDNVFIIKDSDDDTDIQVIGEDDGFFMIDNDGKKPLYIIDGEEASEKEVKKLSPKDIATIDVSKGEASRKKYGKKAKNGVVEIITKKKK